MIWSRSASSQRKHPGLRCERPSQEKLRSSQSEVRGWGMSPSLPSARSPCSNNNPNCRVLTDVALRVDDALACHGQGAGWAMLWGVKAGWCCHYWHEDCDFVSEAQKSLISDHAMGFGSVYAANPDKQRCRGVRGWFDEEEQQIRLKKKKKVVCYTMGRCWTERRVLVRKLCVLSLIVTLCLLTCFSPLDVQCHPAKTFWNTAVWVALLKLKLL